MLPTDVLILTAADGEDAALHAGTEGAVGAGWRRLTQDEKPPDFGFDVWACSFRRLGGGVLNVVHVHAFQMGGEAAGRFAAVLPSFYTPRCLAMCGVCAGKPGDTNLGDVVIANRVYRYDVGGVSGTPDGTEKFEADMQTFQLRADWIGKARTLDVGAAAWLVGRPLPAVDQRRWVLNELHHGRNPAASAEKAERCPHWKEIILGLEKDGFVEIASATLKLAAPGTAFIERELLLHDDSLPEPPPWKILCEPMGTGSSVVKDPGIWAKLKEHQRRISAFEMEASVLGFEGWVQNIPFLVAKGVMDNGDPGKSDQVRTFAARASAEVVIRFLREHLEGPPGPAGVLSTNQWSGRAGEAGSASRDNPGTLLNARWEVVPFIDEVRAKELADLNGWCDPAAAGVSIRLFIGPGGVGKTRLFIEFAARLRAAAPGWDAGFVPDHLSKEQLQQLTLISRPTLFVIDYAEARLDLVHVLTELLKAGERSEHPVRIALLARGVGEWYQATKDQSADLSDMLNRWSPLPLDEPEAAGEVRGRVYRASLAAFAEKIGVALPAEREADLTDPRFGRALYIQMAALAALLGQPTAADELIDRILEHEQRFWLRQFDEHQAGGPLRKKVLGVAAARSVAGLTLCGGSATASDTAEINRRARGPDDAAWPMFLAGVYPGREGRHASGLEPDLLGEALCVKVFDEEGDDGVGYLTRLFEKASEAEVLAGLTLLGRLSLYPECERRAARWIGLLLDQDVVGRAEAAVKAAVSLAGRTAHAPLGAILAGRLRSSDAGVDVAGRVERLLPERSVSLAEVNLWCAELSASACQLSDDQDESSLARRARRLHDLATSFSKVGNRERAMRAARESSKLYRVLAKKSSDAFDPDLAMSLNNLGVMLSERGDRERALRAARESAELYRKLTEACPDAFEPCLARSLNNLGLMLHEVGDREGALGAARESSKLLRKLAMTLPGAFDLDLARSLNNLGLWLSATGDREEALRAARESTELYRALAMTRPDAFEPDLAMSMNNLGNTLSEMGDHEGALGCV